MDMKEKIDVLTQIAKAFNKENITWNLGASCMLYLRKITDRFDDIDMMISEKDVVTVKKIMEKLASPQNIGKKSPQYKTKVFLEYKIDGVDVDIMAGFAIDDGKQVHYFPLIDNKNCEVIQLNGTNIYLEDVQMWLKYYTLMNRTDKIKMLSNYLK